MCNYNDKTLKVVVKNLISCRFMLSTLDNDSENLKF